MFQICPLSRALSLFGETAVPLKKFPEMMFKSFVSLFDAAELNVGQVDEAVIGSRNRI